MKYNAMVTCAAVLGDNKTKANQPADLSDFQTKPNNTVYPYKCQTKDNSLVTYAADLGDNQIKPNNAY